jgi:hypothetical protein
MRSRVEAELTREDEVEKTPAPRLRRRELTTAAIITYKCLDCQPLACTRIVGNI